MLPRIFELVVPARDEDERELRDREARVAWEGLGHDVHELEVRQLGAAELSVAVDVVLDRFVA